MESRKIQAESLNELFHVMDKLVLFHRDLINVLKQEYNDMTNIDTAGLLESAQSKEVFINEIWNFEQQRLKILENIFLKNGLSKDGTLLDLAKHSENNLAEKLKNLRTVLNLLIKDAKEINERNMIFANESLARIETMKRNILGLGNNTKENYTPEGMRTPMPEQGGRFLSTEA